MPYYLRRMRKEDTSQVTEIDREAFPTQWPAPNYQHELRNRLAHYIVVCDRYKTISEPEIETTPGKTQNKPVSILRRLFRRKRLSTQPPSQECILGFTGFWVMADEAHISSISVREEYRRRGIGELLLISLIDMAIKLRASTITLEVRTSNTVARSLYAKHGFRPAGTRRDYYVDRGYNDRGDKIDSREDALLMTTKDITSASFQTQLQQLKQAHTTKWGNTPSQTTG